MQYRNRSVLASLLCNNYEVRNNKLMNKIINTENKTFISYNKYE